MFLRTITLVVVIMAILISSIEGQTGFGNCNLDDGTKPCCGCAFYLCTNNIGGTFGCTGSGYDGSCTCYYTTSGYSSTNGCPNQYRSDCIFDNTDNDGCSDNLCCQDSGTGGAELFRVSSTNVTKARPVLQRLSNLIGES